MVDWRQTVDRIWLCVSICSCGDTNTSAVVTNEELGRRFSNVARCEKLIGWFKEVV